jgi:hypothetical protein
MIIGDLNESFSFITFDDRKNKFDIIAADLSLRSLYKAIPDEESNSNSILLLQKNGSLNKFRNIEGIYNVEYAIDNKEFINKCHIRKP